MALLQMLLVPHGPAGDLRIGERDQDAAADVARKVDEAGHLVAFFARHPDVRRIGNRDETEGEGQHLHDAEPRCLGEGHLQRSDLGSDAEGEDEHDESADGQGAGGDLAGGKAGEGHHDEQSNSARGESEACSSRGVAKSCCMYCGCRTVLALSTPPTNIMRKQQIAKFLKRKSLRLISGFFCRHSHTTRPIMPTTNRAQKKRMKLDANQSFSSPLSSMIWSPPMAMVGRQGPCNPCYEAWRDRP